MESFKKKKKKVLPPFLQQFLKGGGWLLPDDIIQILTAQEDDGGNYHSLGAIHTGPTIIPSAILEQSIFVLYTEYIDFLFSNW